MAKLIKLVDFWIIIGILNHIVILLSVFLIGMRLISTSRNMMKWNELSRQLVAWIVAHPSVRHIQVAL